jgi:hypothetical protein
MSKSMGSSSVETFDWILTEFDSKSGLVDGTAHMFCGMKWYLKAKIEVSDCITLILSCSHHFSGYEATVSIIDKEGVPVGEVVLKETLKCTTNSWEVKEFATKGEIMDPKNGLLTEGSLTIRATVCKGKIPEEPKGSAPKTLLMSRDMEQLLLDGSYSDIELEVEGQRISCHRAILATRSPVFKAMIKPHTKEALESRVEVKGFSVETVKAMITFMYTDHVEAESCSVELLNAAEMYDMKGLKAVCERDLASKLTSENVISLFQEAIKFKALFLRNAAIDFMAENREVVKRKGRFSRNE